jgi:hypothetical protein
VGETGEVQESPAHFALEFEPGYKQVSHQGDPDLDKHGILGSAVKRDYAVAWVIPVNKGF